MITVQQPGLLTTVQDLGRPGYQQYGVVVGGALDALAARTANLLVGNEENAAVLEMAQTGPALCFTQSTLVAWCGADFETQMTVTPCLARVSAMALPIPRPAPVIRAVRWVNVSIFFLIRA